MDRRTFLSTALSAGAAWFTGGSSRAAQEDLASLTLAAASERIRDGSISPVDLARACLDRIERLNPKLNAFIRVTAEEALADARRLEAEQKRGRFRGPLHGIPVALKDLIDVRGLPTTAASAVFEDRVAREDAPVVRRLREQGAVLLGKLNMDEFAYNFTSETSHFGPAHNPWDLERTPGGSSGGSAVAVASRMCFGALGSDTGGSIRQPAAFCGIAGLKGSYGLVSTRGAVPLAWSLDHIGPMCRTVRDTALLLQAIAGHDPDLPGSVRAKPPDYAAALSMDVSRFRLGVARPFFFEDLDAEIADAVETAIRRLEKMTAGVRDVKLPPTDDVPVLVAEAYAYHEKRITEKGYLYHPLTLQNILLGRDVSMPEYVRARRRLLELRREAARVLESVDLVLTPTTPRPPILLELDQGKLPDIVLLRNAIPMNLYDLPTISVPCGFTRSGLPTGLQISGPRLQEPRVLALAHAYEQATEWHERTPPV